MAVVVAILIVPTVCTHSGMAWFGLLGWPITHISTKPVQRTVTSLTRASNAQLVMTRDNVVFCHHTDICVTCHIMSELDVTLMA